MKKTVSFLFIAFLLCGIVFAQRESASISWQNIKNASGLKENTKPYFIDFYTTWCGWCKRMDSSVFTDATIAKILNRYYIPVKFDAECSYEFKWKGVTYTGTPATPTGRKALHSFTKSILGKQLGFPSFGIFAADQSVMEILQGYQTVEELTVVLWYIASGDYNKYSYEKYQAIFDKEIRPKMEAALK